MNARLLSLALTATISTAVGVLAQMNIDRIVTDAQDQQLTTAQVAAESLDSAQAEQRSEVGAQAATAKA